ncbi:DNA mismatch repair protein PMS1, putative, partial [Hepatocystis sp. ex Piliocolobus tephrosceles]
AYEYTLDGANEKQAVVYEYSEPKQNVRAYEYQLEVLNEEENEQIEDLNRNKNSHGNNNSTMSEKHNDKPKEKTFEKLKENIKNSVIKVIPIDINMYINREKLIMENDYDHIHVINLTNSEKVQNNICDQVKKKEKINDYLCLTDEKQEDEYNDLFSKDFDVNKCNSNSNNNNSINYTVNGQNTFSGDNSVVGTNENINFNNIDETQKDLYFKSNLFKKLKICGQFNKGFIISKIDLLYFKKEGSNIKQLDDDNSEIKKSNYALFIIDQHAADEKSNFEKYNKIFTMKSQKLISKMDLELSPAQIHIIKKYEGIFLANGFDIEIVEEPINKKRKINFNKEHNVCNTNDLYSQLENVEETLLQIKVYLLSLPVFNGKMLEVTDFMSLLHHLTEYPVNYDAEKIKQYIQNNKNIDNKKETWFNYNFPRPQRIWRILASKACRNAVMVGKTLNTTEMIKIKKKLSLLQNPWNCPHGRPTIKYIINNIDVQKSFKNYYLKLYDEITNLTLTKDYESYRYLFHNHIFFLIMCSKPLLGPVLKFN